MVSFYENASYRLVYSICVVLLVLRAIDGDDFVNRLSIQRTVGYLYYALGTKRLVFQQKREREITRQSPPKGNPLT